MPVELDKPGFPVPAHQDCLEVVQVIPVKNDRLGIAAAELVAGIPMGIPPLTSQVRDAQD